MAPFLIDDESDVYSVRIWNRDIRNSLLELNRDCSRGEGVIVDLAGGEGPLSDFIDKRNFRYVVIDKNLKSLNASPGDHQKIVADITRVPLSDKAVDIAITITCLQYVDHVRFFEESHRILKSDGIIAIHENGKCNPIILFARLSQRCVGLFKHDVWRYRNTIVKYYDPAFCPPGFDVIYRSSTCLITPFLFGLTKLGIPCNDRILLVLQKLDAYLLQFPLFKKLAFLNIVHFKKRA